MFRCVCLYICPQQDYLQSNERISMHENFIRGVTRAKKLSNKFWGWSGLRSGSGLWSVSHGGDLQSLTYYCLVICLYAIGVQVPFCFKKSNWLKRYISNRISVVQYEADYVQQNTITIDGCKCVAHAIVWQDKYVIWSTNKLYCSRQKCHRKQRLPPHRISRDCTEYVIIQLEIFNMSEWLIVVFIHCFLHCGNIATEGSPKSVLRPTLYRMISMFF